MSNLSLWHINSTHSELREEPTPLQQESMAEEKIIHSLYSLISTGTEKMVALGKVDDRLSEKMSVPYMDGNFNLPIKYGYSLVGKTLDNTLVHLLHPHQQIAKVSSDALFTLPNDIPARRLTLVSNMETIVNALWDSEHLLLNDSNTINVAICGFGNIGALLACTLHQLEITNITIIEADHWRRQKAASLGFEVQSPEQPLDEFDLIYHTTCSSSGLQWCIQSAAFEGTIVELSWYVDKPVSIMLGEHFHYNRLKLISSQVSNIPKHKPKESYVSRKSYAIELLRQSIYDELFADDILLADSPDFFKAMRSGNTPNGIIWCIKYP